MGAREDGEGRDLEGLVARAAQGDDGAWHKLWRALEPWLTRIVQRPRFLGRLGRHDDDTRSIVVAVMGRLRENDFHRLRVYLTAREENPSLAFTTWLRVVAKRVGIDYLRSHPDYVDKRRSADRGTAPGMWVNPSTLPRPSLLPGERPPVTNRGTAAEFLRYAAAELPDDQRRALEMWIQQQDYQDIAAGLGLDGVAKAERLVRAAIERLRRHFRDDGDGS